MYVCVCLHVSTRVCTHARTFTGISPASSERCLRVVVIVVSLFLFRRRSVRDERVSFVAGLFVAWPLPNYKLSTRRERTSRSTAFFADRNRAPIGIVYDIPTRYGSSRCAAPPFRRRTRLTRPRYITRSNRRGASRNFRCDLSLRENPFRTIAIEQLAIRSAIYMVYIYIFLQLIRVYIRMIFRIPRVCKRSPFQKTYWECHEFLFILFLFRAIRRKILSVRLA